MGIETIGEAWNFSWEIHVRCPDDGREGLKHKRQCGYRKYLDLETLVCTRGRDPYSSKPNVLWYAYSRIGGQVASTDSLKLMKISV